MLKLQYFFKTLHLTLYALIDMINNINTLFTYKHCMQGA